MSARSVALGAVAIGAIVAAGVVYEEFDNLVPVVGLGVNYLRFYDAPKGTLTTERAQRVAQDPPAGAVPATPGATPMKINDTVTGAKDWPSYNKTLTSERFSDLAEITGANAGDLSVLCTYDTGQYTGFNTGLLEINGALVFSTEYDIFSIDPNSCKENWRVHEDYTPASPQGVSRGPAFLDDMLFRGTQDGRSSRMISRPASGSGTPGSPTRRRVRARRPRPSHGTGSSSSVMPAAT
jgi:alcohol dehydrogenase (cytochrome c)